MWRLACVFVVGAETAHLFPCVRMGSIEVPSPIPDGDRTRELEGSILFVTSAEADAGPGLLGRVE